MKKIKEQKHCRKIWKRWKRIKAIPTIFNQLFVRKILLKESHYEAHFWNPNKWHKTTESMGAWDTEFRAIHPLATTLRPKKWGKNRRRSTNGGWRYGSYNERAFPTKGKKKFTSGKSSREFSRKKKEWWEDA